MSNVIVERGKPGVTHITLNRPESLNAMSYQLVLDLHDAFDQVTADLDCRVVVLTGAGRGFSAGFDINNAGPEPGFEGTGKVHKMFGAMRDFYGMISHMRSLRQPVIAAVNGPAAGGGFALALGADIRIAPTTARFG